MGAPRDFSLTFSGAAVQEIKATGRHVRVLETPSAGVYLRVDGGSELYREAGQQVNVPEGFNRIEVRSAVAQTVRITVSDTPQDDNRSNVALTVSATVTPGDDFDNGADVAIPATSSAQLLAADATRLAAIITNPSTNATAIRVGKSGVGASSGVIVEPGESVTIAYTGAVHGYNPHASAQTVAAAAVKDV